MMRLPPLPVGVMCAIGVAAAMLLPFAHVAPNRLLSGQPTYPHGLALSLAWLALAATAGSRLPKAFAAVGAVVMVAMLPWLLAHDATRWLAEARPTTRIQPGVGFWTMWLAAALLLLDRLRGLPRAWQAMAWGGIVAMLLVAIWMNGFADVSIVREYHAQRMAFADALGTHVLLSLSTLVIALVLGAPLGWWAWRARRAGGALVGTLAFLQTVPSLALFALLIGPFAWLARQWPALGRLGFGGTGVAPALFALVLYALLPVVRYTMTGLDAAPADAREAARGLGMTRGQLLWRVQLPLGWPVLLAGLRIVAVQTVGLAAVAALIGAGGLGRFVFLGIGQGAVDMVWLGTLAIIALALLVDAAFQGLLAITEGRQ